MLLLGHEGQLGRRVMELALEHGYELNLIASASAAGVSRGGRVNVVEGEYTMLGDLLEAMVRCDCVLSVLEPNAVGWGEDAARRQMEILLSCRAAMDICSVSRIVFIDVVADPAASSSNAQGIAVAPAASPLEQEFAASSQEWTCVQLHRYPREPLSTESCAAISRLLVDCMNDIRYYWKSVVCDCSAAV